GLPASTDQHGDPVHRIAAIALRIPGPGDVRMHLAPGVGAARPDFEITVRRQLHARSPALPVISVFRVCDLGAGPGRAEVGRYIDPADRVVAGPRRATELHLL